MSQYLQIFTYLKEFAKLGNKPVYDIDSSSQYNNTWLHNIPHDAIFYNALYDANYDENKKNYWLKLKKPKLPQMPEPIKPPQKLTDWIVEKSLYDEDAQPFLKEETVLNDDTLYLKDHPELNDILNRYVNNKWLDELLKYQKKYELYQSELEKYKKLQNIYQQFFKLYEEIRDCSDTHELVIGVGVFSYQEKNDSQKYYRHIVTQVVDIAYKNSIITVKVSDEDPKIEKDFILKEVNEASINEAVGYFASIIQGEDKDDVDLLSSQSIEEILSKIANQMGIDQYSHESEKPKTSNKTTIAYAPALISRKKNASKFNEAYSTIIKQVGDQDDGHSIKLIDGLLGKNNQSDTNNSSNNTALPETLYFPNPSNQEQKQIWAKLRNNDVVLVKGPPGTGKSHTIANLICHLLATGNRVLATAYTKRALEVLHEKLPPEYQRLAVNYLGNDPTSKEGLAASVRGILTEINNPQNYDTSDDERALDETKNKLLKTLINVKLLFSEIQRK